MYGKDSELTFKEERDRSAFSDLMRLIKRRECVLFLGSGVSLEIGKPSAENIALELARECEYPSSSPLALSQVAEFYLARHGRARLFERVKELIERPRPSRGLSSYDLIVEIDQLNHPIITTNWDDGLENAFDRAHKAKTVISYNQLASLIERRYAIIKLHGEFRNKPDEPVITREDYRKISQRITQPGDLFSILGNWLATKTVLFVGYSLEDEDFQLLYEYICPVIGTGAPMHYAVMLNPSYLLRDKWLQKNVKLLDSKALPFFKEVYRQTRSFVNRERELDLIYERPVHPYIEVSGFAGCGKTTLLHEAAEKYDLTGNWKHAFLNIGEDEITDELDLAADIFRQLFERRSNEEEKRVALEARGAIAQRFIEQAREEIARQKNIGARDVLEPDARKHGATLIVRDLAQRVANNYILIVFDSSEWFPMFLQQWLEEMFIPTLEKQVVEPKEQLRLVFAGRYVLPWRNPRIKNNLTQMELTPFIEVPIGKMLDGMLLLKGRELQREEREWIVREVLDITSGHPRSIYQLLDEITRRDAALPRDYFAVERQRLFEKHVLSVVDSQILSKIKQGYLRSILLVISIFRRILAEFLDVVQCPEGIEKQSMNSLRLIGDLVNETHLVSNPQVGDSLYCIDPVIRRILGMAIELTDQQRYVALNRLALNTFRAWTRGQSPLGLALSKPPDSSLAISYIVEALFHRVALLRINGDAAPLESLRKQLQDDLQVLAKLEPAEIVRVGQQLKSVLEHDRELSENTVRLVGEAGYALFQEIVESWIPV